MSPERLVSFFPLFVLLLAWSVLFPPLPHSPEATTTPAIATRSTPPMTDSGNQHRVRLLRLLRLRDGRSSSSSGAPELFAAIRAAKFLAIVAVLDALAALWALHACHT